MLAKPSVDPATSYEQACERVRRFQAYDDERILPEARTTLLDHGRCTELAVVLLHGFTNHPGQYRAFAPMVYARGANVFIPRMPEQGDRDRMSRRLARLTAESLLDRASEAVDIACGLGERVCVAGISSSALVCAYFAQYRADVSRAIAIAPVFAMLKLPYWVSVAASRMMLVLPNTFLWWDPRLRENQHPATAYPQFPTHALAQTMRIGQDVYGASKRQPYASGCVNLVTNAHDPAVNNAVSEQVVRRWQRQRSSGVSSYEFIDLPVNHDIIDPDNPRARTDVVYPKLLELIVS